jgi:hypothetical protein
MLTAVLPNDLQTKFEQMARLTFGETGTDRALTEAIEAWLQTRRKQLIEAERKENLRAFELLRPEIEKFPEGKWFVIAHGRLQQVTDSLKQASRIATDANHRIVMQVKPDLAPKTTELGWQITYD